MPMPRASVITATAVKAGDFSSIRRPYRISCRKVPMVAEPYSGNEGTTSKALQAGQGHAETRKIVLERAYRDRCLVSDRARRRRRADGEHPSRAAALDRLQSAQTLAAPPPEAVHPAQLDRVRRARNCDTASARHPVFVDGGVPPARYRAPDLVADAASREHVGSRRALPRRVRRHHFVLPAC